MDLWGFICRGRRECDQGDRKDCIPRGAGVEHIAVREDRERPVRNTEK